MEIKAEDNKFAKKNSNKQYENRGGNNQNNNFNKGARYTPSANEEAIAISMGINYKKEKEFEIVIGKN